MAKVPAIIPVSYLGQNAARVLSDAKTSGKPVFITQRGRATAVLMSLDAFERFEAERELLGLLARGAKEIAAGVGQGDVKGIRNGFGLKAGSNNGSRHLFRSPGRPAPCPCCV
jgi:prevent-host-death family protein